jgi:hypothetical protein
MTKITLQMPNLSTRSLPVVRFLLPQLLIGRVRSDTLGLHLREFVRLLDKAIFEYEDARIAFETGSEDARYILPQLAFTNHFETCINAIARLLRLMDAMSHVHGDAASTRTMRRVAHSSSEAVRGVRNTVEHMDESIQGGRHASGDPVMITISDDGREAIVGDRSIALAVVAAALTALHRIALAILEDGSMTSLPEMR